MDNPLVYIPRDRRHALAHGQTIPDRTHGAALFADISGFTQLTEALVRELGPQRGAEELTRYLNLVYDAVIDKLHSYGGSVIAFAGDAITCWLDGDNGLRATACALAMQTAMESFAAISTPAGSTVTLAMKAAVAVGPARRFLVGDPALRVIDALAGATLARLAHAEHQAKRGEVVLALDAHWWEPASEKNMTPPLYVLDDMVEISELRHDQETGQTVGVVQGLRQPIADRPWPDLALDALSDEQVRVWLLLPVYERLRRGLGDFLAELRPTVALFVRFGGIDYDNDEEAGAKLDAYMRWVQDIVTRYEGTLIDLNIGDKGSYLYINFGAPLAHEDNADRAAAAALALRTLPASLAYIGQVQIGISQGRMRAGAYGGANHRTYGVLGDEVNMAARLMMAAKPGQILVSLAAQRSISQGFIFEELPSIRVKGKSEPAIIFALSDTRQPGGFHHATPAYTLPMVGRQTELALITQKMAQAAHGRGQIIGITGEAGLGKSRLVTEMLRLAGEQQFSVYGGESESYGINSAYLAWQPVWRSLFGLDATWPVRRQMRALQNKLEEIDPTLVARLPLLGAVLNIELPDTTLTQSFDAKLRKTSLEALLVDCLRAAARKSPLLIVLEDCQWLDALSHDLVEAMGNAIADLPVLLVLAYRPLEQARLRTTRISQLPYYTEIQLAPLGFEEATQFVGVKLAQMLGADLPASPTLIKRITTEAQGNPFYIEELINYVHYRGVNFADSAALEQIELPDSLQRLVLSLVDQLSESQKITVKVASVIGRVFRAAWLQGAYPELGDLSRVSADLQILQQQDLMLLEPAEPELMYLFRQVITQGVTYESLPFSMKSVLHEQIGQFIEQAYPDLLNQYLDLLAYHYDRSDNQLKKRHYLLRAGEVAQSNYANTAAIDYFTRLLPILSDAERGEVLLKLGQVLDTVGDYEQADLRFRTALGLAEEQHEPRLQTECQIALGELRRKQSQYAEAAAYFAQAQALAEQINDRAGVAKALICAGTLAVQQGDYTAAHTLYVQSLAIRRQLNDQPNIANLLNNMAIVATTQGDFAGAHTMFDESLTVRRSLQDKWGVANSLNNLGELALIQQTYNEAYAYLEEAVNTLREIGDKWELGNALVTLGNALRAMGEYRAAYPLYQESLQINRDLGDRRTLAYLLENIGVLFALQGEAERALKLVGAAATLREILRAPLFPAEKSQLESALEPARQTLGAAAATAASEAGRALTLDEAMAIVLV
ncbi:MAG: tetratricopeptide repeat protein [Chloroflexi bacterium]|nr:tetratricopeptide repeat protein [Chloroflexota bacterium]